MPKSKKKMEAVEIQIEHIQQDNATFCLVGMSPEVSNRMSQKAKFELLYPHGPLNANERRNKLKHHPIEEFHAAAHRMPSGEETLLAVPGASVKGVLKSAALDLPGTSKAQIGRLTWVQGEYIPIYGVPKLYMTVVRLADMKQTPDIRTRVILPEWAMKVKINWVKPHLNETSILNLLAAGGVITGIGDGRQEKGTLSFGQFRVCHPEDPEFLRIVKAGGRKAQKEAMTKAEPYDIESAELLARFHEELKRRGDAKSTSKTRTAKVRPRRTPKVDGHDATEQVMA